MVGNFVYILTYNVTNDLFILVPFGESEQRTWSYWWVCHHL